MAVKVACLSWLLIALFEYALAPRPVAPWRRPGCVWVIQAGLWLCVFGVLLLLYRRPWFAAINGMAIVVVLGAINNVKMHTLREPFIFQDFDYLIDLFRYPRLYFPFFGWWRALGLAVLYMAAMGLGLWLESALSLAALWPEILVYVGLGGVLLGLMAKYPPPIACAPVDDLRRLGFVAALWAYGWQEFRQRRLVPEQPYAALGKPSGIARAANPIGQKVLPDQDAPADIVVIQSESFFDARRLWQGIRPGILAEFDLLRAQAVETGLLQVPSWGANTVRTEFGFLSGLPESAMGIHAFNPYRQLARHGVATLATALRQRGYRTICIHPYAAGFYARDIVYPRMGFDEFIDESAFTDNDRAGPYIGDAAVARKIQALLDDRPGRQPVFLFVITMENHGPLHLEQVAPGDIERLYTQLPPGQQDELTIYLRHLARADQMFGQLRRHAGTMLRAPWLCIYGDHVPILSQAYRTLGAPEGETDYLIWRPGHERLTQLQHPLIHPQPAPVPVHMLGRRLLDYVLS